MIFIRCDIDPIPDEQSYYDWEEELGGEAGPWGFNVFKTKEEAELAFGDIADLLVETDHGWQLPTPPKTLFGYNMDAPSSDLTVDDKIMLFSLNYSMGFIQVFEGIPVGDRFLNSIESKYVGTDGELFVPIKMIACHEIPRDFIGSDYNIISSWVRRRDWMNNPYNTQKTANKLSMFLRAAQSNWCDLTDEQIRQEWDWEYLPHVQPAFGDLFKGFDEFKQQVKSATVVDWIESLDSQTSYRSRCRTLDELKDLTSNYRHPRDVDDLVNKMKIGVALPYPLILDIKGQFRVMSGNTRMDIAYILGIVPKVKVIKC